MSNDLKRQADALRRVRRTIAKLRTVLSGVEMYLLDIPADVRTEEEHNLYQRVHRALHGDKTANNERNDS
jgi:hypothetical protein